MHEEKKELLEIYKIHCEFADRVSQRREGANKLYVSLLTGILVFSTAFLRYEGSDTFSSPLLIITGTLSMLLSLSWFIVIRSYRQLNTGKFQALDELEEKLSYAFYKREWELLKKGKNKNKYWELTIVKTFLPVIFFLLSLIFVTIVLAF